MTELTPRNSIPYPSEREEPFYDTAKAGELASDAALYANSENTNLIFYGGGAVSFDAGTDTVFWTERINVTGFTTGYVGFIPGPRSLSIQEGEVVFFKMLRLIRDQDTELTVYSGNRIFLEGTRLHDLKLFVTRQNDVLYFGDGKSLRSGETGPLWGGGLTPTAATIPHEHADPFVVTPSNGTFVLSPTPVITSPDLARVDVFKNGQLLVEGVGEDYTVDLGTGDITLAVAANGTDQYQVWREIRDFPSVTTQHEHAPKLILTPVPGTGVLNALATAPILERVDVFKNGVLLVEGAGDDFTVDLGTGLITLATLSVLNDKFEIHRRLAV